MTPDDSHIAFRSRPVEQQRAVSVQTCPGNNVAADEESRNRDVRAFFLHEEKFINVFHKNRHQTKHVRNTLRYFKCRGWKDYSVMCEMWKLFSPIRWADVPRMKIYKPQYRKCERLCVCVSLRFRELPLLPPIFHTSCSSGISSWPAFGWCTFQVNSGRRVDSSSSVAPPSWCVINSKYLAARCCLHRVVNRWTAIFGRNGIHTGNL